MRITRRQGLGSLAAVAAAGALPRAARAQARQETARTETLRQVMGGTINTLDPTAPGSTREAFGTSMSIYDRLARFGRKRIEGGYVFDLDAVSGELAERIERADEGRRLVFHLREGATWHDGTPVTAGDVKWSLDRAVSAKSLAGPQLTSGSLTKPEQFRVAGERVVEVLLERPDRLALANLCVPYAMMINSTLAKQHASADDPWAMAWLKENTAAGGAYTVETSRPGQQLVLRRNEAWKSGPTPAFRRVIVQTVPEATTRANLVERGDADICIDLQASDIPVLVQRGRPKIVSVPQTNAFNAAVFNTQAAPFDNPKVRQAIAAALPYADMFKAALFERGRPLFGAHWSQPPDASFPQPLPLNTDLAAAKRLLAEAGLPNGFSTTFSFAAGLSAMGEPLAALVKEACGRIGVAVEVQKMPDAQFQTMQVERRLPFFLETGTAWLPTPDYFFRTYFYAPQRWNFSGWNDKLVADEVEALRFESDPARYEAGSRRMIARLAEAVPLAMLWQANHDAAMAPDIDGYTYWFYRQVDYRELRRA